MPFIRRTIASSVGGGSTFSTTFSTNENPISEGGVWYKNPSNAWQNILTSGGDALAAAYSNQTGHTDDAYSYLQNWTGNDYEIIATMRKGGVNQGEVEILGRVSDDASNTWAYEVLCNTAGGWQLVRWKGALDQYEVIYPSGGGLDTGFGGDGSQHRAIFSGNLFSFYQRQVSTDSWTTRVTSLDIEHAATASGYYATGKPGMGIYVRSASSNISYTGWQDYQVTAL